MNKYIVNGLINATEVHSSNQCHSANQCHGLIHGAMQWLRGYWDKVSEVDTFEAGLELTTIGLIAEQMVSLLSKDYPDYAETLNACYVAIEQYRKDLPYAEKLMKR